MTAEPLTTLQVISPVDGSVYVERPLADDAVIAAALATARLAADRWGRTAVTERVAVCARLLDRLKPGHARIAESLAWQVGTPLAQAEAEVAEAEDLVRTMMGLGPSVLADIHGPEEPGIERLVRRLPRGVVMLTLPWAQPWLTALALMLPTVIAGNALIVRPSPQAPLAGELIAKAFKDAGLPAGVVQALHLAEADVARVAGAVETDMVIHAGETAMTRWIAAAASTRNRPLEILGPGVDAAYVRPDATLPAAAAALARAACTDAGRAFGAPRRLYAHRDIRRDLESLLAGEMQALHLGSPLDRSATLGPVARQEEATLLRQRLAQAEMQGAVQVVDPAGFAADDGAGVYVAPRVVSGCLQVMDLVSQPTAGPVIAVVEVSSDEEAVALMNDGAHARAASLWTEDAAEAHRMASGLRLGAVYQNLCGLLDANLAWTGVKQSGEGVMFSRTFYERVTRPMTLNFRHRA